MKKFILIFAAVIIGIVIFSAIFLNDVVSPEPTSTGTSVPQEVKEAIIPWDSYDAIYDRHWATSKMTSYWDYLLVDFDRGVITIIHTKLGRGSLGIIIQSVNSRKISFNYSSEQYYDMNGYELFFADDKLEYRGEKYGNIVTTSELNEVKEKVNNWIKNRKLSEIKKAFGVDN